MILFIQELEKAKSDVALQTTEFKTLKKENRKRKKIIQAYQDMLNSGATGIHSVSSLGMLSFVTCLGSSFSFCSAQCVRESL